MNNEDKLVIRDRKQMEDLFEYRLRQFDEQRIKNLTIFNSNETDKMIHIIIDQYRNYRHGQIAGLNLDIFIVSDNAEEYPPEIKEALEKYPDRYIVMHITPTNRFQFNLIQDFQNNLDNNEVVFK